MCKPVERWRRYGALPAAERWLLWRAVCWLLVAGLWLRWRGLQRAQAGLARLGAPGGAVAPAAPAAAGLARAQRLAHLVAVAARWGPYRATCLPRALALQHLLRQAGLRAELRLGVRKHQGALQAHAWVEHAGVPLIDGPEVHQHYRAFDRGFHADRWT